MRTATLIALCLAACSQQETPATDGPPTLSVQLIEAHDASGISSAKCPTDTRVIGGGCDCDSAEDWVFGFGPAGNAYGCACAGARNLGAKATATCAKVAPLWTASPASTDRAADQWVAEMRERRAARR